MPIAKDYEIQQIEVIPATGEVYLHFNLLVVDNGIVAFSNNHRFYVASNMEIPELETMINQQLAEGEYPALTAEDSACLNAVINAARNNLAKEKIPRSAPIAPPPETFAMPELNPGKAPEPQLQPPEPKRKTE